MADRIPRDIGALAKRIGDFQVEGQADLALLIEMLRVFNVEASVVNGYAEFEIFQAIRIAEGGKSQRHAKQVTRPIRNAVTLNLLAARRVTQAYSTFLKLFAEQIAAARRPKGRGRSWKWEQSGTRSRIPTPGSVPNSPPRQPSGNGNGGGNGGGGVFAKGWS